MTGSSYPIIKKPSIGEFKIRPNLDYDKVRHGFDWGQMYDELDWLPGGYLNMAHEAIDRHAYGRNRDKVALIWEGKNGEREDYTFGDIKRESDRFANVLKSLGIGKGDRVFIYLDRVPELYIAFFGILKVGAIAGPLFSAFGPEPVKERMQDSEAKVLITQPDLRLKISEIIRELFELQHIVVVNKGNRDLNFIDPQDLDYYEEMGKAPPNFEIENTSQYDYSFMHYTSGRTGKPKGVMHRHQAIVQHYATGKWALDLHSDDVFWCTADPGWVTGTSYGILAPWVNGVTQLVYEDGFRASAWYELMQKHKVSVLYSAPSAIRRLMNEGDDLPRNHDLSSLRFAASVGEFLNPDIVAWSEKALGAPFHDGWLQTETGAILCANYASEDIRLGSMGKSFPGIELAIVDEDFKPVPNGAEGNLAAQPEWPSMFHSYWRNEELYNSCFRKGWYVTGDRARVDEDGYFWFVSESSGK